MGLFAGGVQLKFYIKSINLITKAPLPKPERKKDSELLDLGAAAKMLQTTKADLSRLIDRGKFPCVQSSGGAPKVPRGEVEKLLPPPLL